MLDRLAGLETEYAIRHSPRPGRVRERNATIVLRILEQIKSLVKTLPGPAVWSSHRVFSENGGSFYHEFQPHAVKDGLLEAATPECRGPLQLLRYQRAQEALLRQVLDRLNASESIGLLKNCRDAAGNIYGVQESYEAVVASGFALFAYRVGLVAMAPVSIATVAVMWALLGVFFGAALVIVFTLFVASLFRGARRSDNSDEWLERVFGFVELFVFGAVAVPVSFGYAMLFRLCAFRSIRRNVTAFLMSRPVLTGTGTLESDGTFTLSEKGPGIRGLVGVTPWTTPRCLFHIGHFIKALAFPFAGMRKRLALFGRRQRLQISLSDGNHCDVAEYLKVATMTLVLDMAEAGVLRDAPRLAHPIAALRAVVADPTLTVRVKMAGRREPMSALEIQRWYLDRAKTFVADHPTPAMEARDVINTWEHALNGLAADPASLIGRIDWVTKRALLEQAGAEAGHAVLKKIDLRYHELDHGYAARLVRAGLCPQLVDAGDVERAIRNAPERSPAVNRSWLVRRWSGSKLKVEIDWGQARIGGRFNGKIISLDDYR